MRGTLLFFLLAFSSTYAVQAQEGRPQSFYRSAFIPYVEYSNASSHILIGTAYNRRLAASGIEYARRLLQSERLAWYYVADLRPVMFLQDPVSSTTQTVQFGTQAHYGPFLIQTGPIERACHSTTFVEASNSDQPKQTIVDTVTCGTRWTYLGGVSPLGQEVVFLPKSRIQPYALGNAGIVVATRDVPSDYSSAFNFTFEFGVGMRLLPTPTRGVSIDYRIRHLSNGYLGFNNPGIDNQILRVSYVFGLR